LARWLALRPKVLIVDEPTRGIDGGAKVEVHNHRSGRRALFTMEKGPSGEIVFDQAVAAWQGAGARSVVFSPKVISIVKKYGVASLLASGVISQDMADEMKRQGIDKGT
jgi:hypothetical protein